MAIRKSVRIYDLARELKQDTKRVMEDLRRAGADVSVASNSVSAEFAEKVRSKYFPKTEIAPKRAIKVIKAAKKQDTPHVEEVAEVHEPSIEAETPAEAPVAEQIPEVPAAEPIVSEARAGVKVKFVPEGKVSPWFSIGAGYSLYEHSANLLNGLVSPVPRHLNRGTIGYGGGLDWKAWRNVSLRMEARDFYSGGVAYNVTGTGGGQHNQVAGGGLVLRFK